MKIQKPTRPFEVSHSEYPFTDRWMPYQDGYLHYVDEGQGPAVLLLHGNPTWSYLYRNVIREMRNECRMIAVDYPGFGFSKAPSNYRFTPAEHAEAVKGLIEHLGLKEFVLVVQDWGGPIGMSYAVHNSDKIRGLVVMNSWAWGASVPQMLFSLVMGGWPLGYWLQTRRNFFVTSILPRGIFHKEKITPELHQAYLAPFSTPQSRLPTWVFPRSIRKARKWLESIEARLPVLSTTPTQILWGKKDEPGFRANVEMKKWQTYLKAHETEVLDDASHFVQEDRPDRLIAAIRRVILRTSTMARQ